MKDLSFKGARQEALRLLGRKASSRQNIYQATLRKGFIKEDILAVLDELENAGYLNDDEFARLTVESLSSRLYGPHKMLAALLTRGVDVALAKRVITDFYHENNEKELALCVARRAWEKGERDFKRIALLLQRKGFAPALACRVLEEEFSFYLDIMS